MRSPTDYTITCKQCTTEHEAFSYDNAVAWMQSHKCGETSNPYHHPPMS